MGWDARWVDSLILPLRSSGIDSEHAYGSSRRNEANRPFFGVEAALVEEIGENFVRRSRDGDAFVVRMRIDDEEDARSPLLIFVQRERDMRRSRPHRRQLSLTNHVADEAIDHFWIHVRMRTRDRNEIEPMCVERRLEGTERAIA